MQCERRIKKRQHLTYFTTDYALPWAPAVLTSSPALQSGEARAQFREIIARRYAIRRHGGYVFGGWCSTSGNNGTMRLKTYRIRNGMVKMTAAVSSPSFSQTPGK